MEILLDQILPYGIIAAVAVIVGLWIGRARRSGINPFDPRSLDRLPSGVQEDDDVKFDWSAADERGRFRQRR
jgi:hypothetical protein